MRACIYPTYDVLTCFVHRSLGIAVVQIKKPTTTKMLYHAVFAAIVLVHAALVDADAVQEKKEVVTDEGVLVMTTDNFDQVVDDSEYLLVKFCEYTRREHETVFHGMLREREREVRKLFVATPSAPLVPIS